MSSSLHCPPLSPVAAAETFRVHNRSPIPSRTKQRYRKKAFQQPGKMPFPARRAANLPVDPCSEKQMCRFTLLTWNGTLGRESPPRADCSRPDDQRCSPLDRGKDSRHGNKYDMIRISHDRVCFGFVLSLPFRRGKATCFHYCSTSTSTRNSDLDYQYCYSIEIDFYQLIIENLDKFQ